MLICRQVTIALIVLTFTAAHAWAVTTITPGDNFTESTLELTAPDGSGDDGDYSFDDAGEEELELEIEGDTFTIKGEIKDEVEVDADDTELETKAKMEARGKVELDLEELTGSDPAGVFSEQFQIAEYEIESIGEDDDIEIKAEFKGKVDHELEGESEVDEDVNVESAFDQISETAHAISLEDFSETLKLKSKIEMETKAKSDIGIDSDAISSVANAFANTTDAAIVYETELVDSDAKIETDTEIKIDVKVESKLEGSEVGGTSAEDVYEQDLASTVQHDFVLENSDVEIKLDYKANIKVDFDLEGSADDLALAAEHEADSETIWTFETDKAIEITDFKFKLASDADNADISLALLSIMGDDINFVSDGDADLDIDDLPTTVLGPGFYEILIDLQAEIGDDSDEAIEASYEFDVEFFLEAHTTGGAPLTLALSSATPVENFTSHNVVPEPATAGLALLSLLAVARRRRGIR